MGAIVLTLAALNAGDVDLSRLTEFELKERGESAFADGVRHRDDPDAARLRFRSAAICFEELRRRGARNPALYRNLGNSYLLGGDVARAILSYRRGLVLAPDDHDLSVNLDAARERVSYPAGSRLGRPGPEGQAGYLARIGGDWLIGGAFLLYAVTCVVLTRWLMLRTLRLLAVGLVALLGAGVLTMMAVREASKLSSGPVVVVAEDGVLLRRGDSLQYPPRYDAPVNRGVEARLLHRRGEWLQIELSGGEVGWVMQEYALVDQEDD